MQSGLSSAEEEKAFLDNIAKNVKEKRLEKGISQLEVTLSIGQSLGGFYANMENNAHGKYFNLLHLFKLSRLFECDVQDFFVC